MNFFGMDKAKVQIVITRLLFLFLLCLTLTTSYSQDPFYLRHTTEDGLPSNTVYKIVESKDGFLWIATDKGISKFDGQSFQAYNLKNKFTSLDILDIYLDSYDRLWVGSISGELAYIKNDSLHNLSEKIDFDGVGLRHFQEYKEFISIVPLNFFNKAYLIDSTGQVFDQKEIIKIDTTFTTLWENNNGPSSIFLTGSNPIGKILVTTENKTKVKLFETDFFGNFVYHQDEQELLGAQGLLFYRIFPDMKIDLINSETLGINSSISRIQRIEDDLWLSSNGGGIYKMVDYYNGVKEILNYFSNVSITSIQIDQFDNFWFSTLEDGIIKVPKEKIENYKNIDDQELSNTSIGVLEDLIYAGNSKGELFQIKAGVVKKIKTPNRKLNKYRDVVKYKNALWLVSDYEIGRIQDGEYHSWPFECAKSLEIYKDTLFVAGCSAISKYLIIENDIEFVESNNGKRFMSIAIDSASNVLLANKELFELHKDQVNSIKTDHFSIKSGVNDLEVIYDSILCFCTSNGLVLKRNKEEIFYSVEDGLVSNSCNKIFINENEIWYATEKGLNHLKIDPQTLNLSSIELYNQNSGLVANDVLDVWIEKDFIYTAGSKGVSKLEVKTIEYDKPEIYLKKVVVNQTQEKIANKYKLDFKNNSLRFKFSAKYFGGDLQYRYKLDGLETEWSLTKQPEIYYPSLPPGKYTLKIETFVNRVGGENSSSMDIPIQIVRPFWRNPIFFFISILLLGFFMLYYFYNKLKTKRRAEILNQQIKEAEQIAMRAQMNPHFVHNSLNSIQDLILSKDERTANKYLSKFSRLMRVVMKNSEQPFISIAKELEGLRYYIELESLRFDDNFEYKIKIDKSIDEEQDLIPTAMLQLFVENAIWHGLLPLKSNALLEIEFSKADGIIEIEIRDNGIGINNTKKKKDSSAIQNIENRIALLNKSKKEKIILETFDRQEKYNQKGTVVLLKVPKSVIR